MAEGDTQEMPQRAMQHAGCHQLVDPSDPLDGRCEVEPLAGVDQSSVRPISQSTWVSSMSSLGCARACARDSCRKASLIPTAAVMRTAMMLPMRCDCAAALHVRPELKDRCAPAVSAEARTHRILAWHSENKLTWCDADDPGGW
eukprot:CAMPEP_0119410408 /NCGR_PEP_ID=MMETSP1335-20130426/3439_1 /TAXON_ID=259385 /ORGANISM="Chrysoculter rhomboideus, Strain RCC1486" /LENGTH=143 /DNA_ID=CAMNT_0007434933 /DNA_START=292 /DNA_END=721 /DNA_ORIENTATION=+